MMMHDNWIFTNSTNNKIIPFIGTECRVATPRRKEDGHRICLAYKPGGDPLRDWIFATSTVVKIQKTAYPEEGYATLEVHTHNSVYFFYKKL